MQSLGYEYIGKTFCICLENSRGRLLYMNGLRHRAFPLETTTQYTEFLFDIYQSIDDLLGDYRHHYQDERNVRLIYGCVYYSTDTHEAIVLSRNSEISRFQCHIRNYMRTKSQEIECRSHPYSEVFYSWKGRYPTYQEYKDILCKIRL